MVATSTVLIDELFETSSSRFLTVLLESQADKKLAAFAERFYRDRRPWAREALLDYIDDGCDRPGHRALVKRLFKLAESAEDDEVMARFLVVFDRLIEHKVKLKRRWDWRSNTFRTYYKKVPDRSYPHHVERNPILARALSDAGVYRRFSKATRLYLQRRTLRYLRRLGSKDTNRFRQVAIDALSRYRDDHREHPVRLVDAWGLMHLLYHGSEILNRDPRGIRIRQGRTLAELEPAPMHADLWRGCFEDLLSLATSAQALVVRRFAIAWLRREYTSELEGMDIDLLRPLLKSPHPDVQAFAIERLGNAQGLERLPVQTWLNLLEVDNPLALTLLCEHVERCMTSERLTLAQCINLACARPLPVAQLGLRWAREKSLSSEDLEIVALLRNAQAAPVRDEGICWLVEIVKEEGETDQLRELIDARYDDVREKALIVLGEVDRFRDEPSLWAALAESPYDDVRRFLLQHLTERLSHLTERSVQQVWATTLLGVHRGSRTKRTVLRQLAERIEGDTEVAEELVPLLAIALRSVREPERRAAMAAVGRAAFRNDALRDVILRHIPELDLFESDDGRVPS